MEKLYKIINITYIIWIIFLIISFNTQWLGVLFPLTISFWLFCLSFILILIYSYIKINNFKLFFINVVIYLLILWISVVISNIIIYLFYDIVDNVNFDDIVIILWPIIGWFFIIKSLKKTIKIF